MFMCNVHIHREHELFTYDVNIHYNVEIRQYRPLTEIR